MRDPVSIERVKKLHPAVKDEVVKLIDQAEAGLPEYVAIRIAQGLRTIAEQDGLYALGRTKKNPDGYHSTKKPLGNIVTNAKGGSSIHNYGLAIDFCLLIDKDRNGTFETVSWDMNTDWDGDRIKDWTEVVTVFTDAGWVWGGNWKSFKDNPHLEKTFGYTWRQLLVMYNNKQFIEGTKFVKI